MYGSTHGIGYDGGGRSPFECLRRDDDFHRTNNTVRP
jgi:hypothetical protein